MTNFLSSPVLSAAGFAFVDWVVSSVLDFAAAPFSMWAITSPTLAMSPFFFKIFVMVPAAGAGSSMVAFSDSMLTMFSSLATESPSFFNHPPISTSVIDSPTSGTFSSVAIIFYLKASDKICCCSALCRFAEPVAGLAEAGRATPENGNLPKSFSPNFRRKCGHAPMFCGSSWTQ